MIASPATGWVFAGWGGDCSGQTSCELTTDSTHSVSAKFTKTRTLTVTVPGGARVTGTGIDCPGDCTETFNSATTVVLYVTTDDNQQFTGWTGGCSGTQPTCSVPVDGVVAVGLNLACRMGSRCRSPRPALRR